MSREQKYSLTLQAGLEPVQVFELDQAELIIGRDRDADIVIASPGVSRRHARLSYQGGDYYLEDLRSSNGTYLNGKAVLNPTRLHPGDLIRLGEEIVLVFQAANAAEASTQFAQVDSNPSLEGQQTASDAPQWDAFALPQLIVSVSGAPPRTYPLTGEQITIGRARDNDIVIPAAIVSRHQARLERTREGYQIVNLPGAANPLLWMGKPFQGAHHLEDQDEIKVASPVPGMEVCLMYRSAQRAGTAQLSPSPGGAPLHAELPSKPDQTMLEAGLDLERMRTPAQLIVTVAGNPPQAYPLVGNRISFGRAEDNDIVIPSRIVSRHHGLLESVPGGYELSVLPEAINTLLLQGRPVTTRQRLHHGDVLRIDSSLPGMMVTMSYESPSEAAGTLQTQTITFGEKTLLTVGRDASNDIRLDFPTVSRFHAQIEKVGRRYRVTDLRSSNGTFVNDRRISTQAWLEPGDTIRIGPYRFTVGEEEFIQYAETSGLRVEAYGLNKWVRKNLNILENISLVFQPREFIVVVGQSGGGKTTLVDAIAGYRPATQGRVFVNGVDVYRNFDAIRNEIGYVPQRDIIHMELTVYQALEYAARLRMPPDTTKAERHQRIMEVLDELDLTHRKDVQISGLSGGQQKRVSIGVELLTRPGLFFLDEPTSGLDPGTETAFMHLMRRLADQGRTIVMVTHATKNVMLADKVVFLARGGYLAWFGPPDEALEYFDQYRSERERLIRDMEFDQIYAILDDPSKGSAQEWSQRYQEHEAYQKYIVQPLQSRRNTLPLMEVVQKQGRNGGSPPGRGRGRVSSLSQFFILSSRNLKILTRDRSSLILMLLTAPLVGALDFVIAPLMGKDPFNIQTGDAANASVTLFLLTIYCLLVGGLSQMREIVKEADIYRRERLVNLRILPYVLSKIWVAMILAFYHGLAYAAIHYVAFRMPGGVNDFLAFYFTLVLAVMAGMVGGILASALAPNASSAPLIMILLIVPLIVLSGVLAPVPGSISSIASTRWAFQGLIGISGMGSDVAADVCWELPKELREKMTLDDKQAAGCRCMGVAIFKTCNFPGIGKFYTPEIDQPAPSKPADLRPKPPEPVIPPAPEAPADKYDAVKVAQFLEALQSYQKEVERIQNAYKNEMSLYEAEANVYQAEMIQYQKDLAKWEIARASAVQGAEGTINSLREQYGWAWVNKEDATTYRAWLMSAWGAQLGIVFVYFILILLLMKRKDVK